MHLFLSLGLAIKVLSYRRNIATQKLCFAALHFGSKLMNLFLLSMRCPKTACGSEKISRGCSFFQVSPLRQHAAEPQLEILVLEALQAHLSAKSPGGQHLLPAAGICTDPQKHRNFCSD
jgi:hypothetical protein